VVSLGKMSGSSQRRLVAGVCLAMIATGCVAPARTADAYVGKAEASAAVALSAVQTAALTLEVVQQQGLFAPQVSVLMAEAEQAASTAESTFSSIQPPDTSLDDYRERLGEILTRATDVLATLRIASRRGDLGDIDARQRELAELISELERFAGSEA
jgi:hypothetical protein